MTEFDDLMNEVAPNPKPNKMKPDDPAYWMLFDGVESTPVVYSATCYICRDPEFAMMGMPLCRKCPACEGHIQADDTICDNCGLDDQAFWELVAGQFNDKIKKLSKCFNTDCPDYKAKMPTVTHLEAAIAALKREMEKNDNLCHHRS